MGHGPLTFRDEYGARSEEGELIDDSAVVGDLAHRAAQTYGLRRAQRMMGLKFCAGEIPAVTDFAALCEREHYFAIRFTPVAVRSRD